MKLLIYVFLVSSVTATRQFYELSNVQAFLENFGLHLSQNHEIDKAPPELSLGQLNGIQTVQVNTKACPPGTVLNIAGSCTEPVVERKIFLFSSPEETKSSKKVIVNPRAGYRVILINNLDRIPNKEETLISKKLNHLQTLNTLKNRQKSPFEDVTTTFNDLENQIELNATTFDYQSSLELINSENITNIENLKVDMLTNVSEIASTQETIEEGKEAESLVELAETKNDKLLAPAVLNTFEKSELSETEIPTQMAAASISNFDIQTEARLPTLEITNANQNLQPFVPGISQNTLITKTQRKQRNKEIHDSFNHFNAPLNIHSGPLHPHFFFHNEGYNQRLGPNGSPLLFNPLNVKVFPNNFFRSSYYPAINSIVPNSLRLSASLPFINNPSYKQPDQSVFYNLALSNNELPSQGPGFMFLPLWKTSKLDRFPFLALSKNSFHNQRFPFRATTPFLERPNRIQGINSQVDSIMNSNLFLLPNDVKMTAGLRLNNAIGNTSNSGGGNFPNLPIQGTHFRKKPDRTHYFAKEHLIDFQTDLGQKLTRSQSHFALNQKRKRPIQSEQTKFLQTAHSDLQNLFPAKFVNNQDINKHPRLAEEQVANGGYENQGENLKGKGNKMLKLEVTQLSQIENERDQISSQIDFINSRDANNLNSSLHLKSDPVQISTQEGLTFGSKKEHPRSFQSMTEDNRSHSDILTHQKVFSVDKNIILPASLSGKTHLETNENLRSLEKSHKSIFGLETDLQSRTASTKAVVKSKEVSSKAVQTTEAETSDPAKRLPLVKSESPSPAFENQHVSYSRDHNFRNSFPSFTKGSNSESFIKINFGSIKDFPSVYVDLSKNQSSHKTSK